ncbi:chloride channel protein [Lentilitoribacter sp. Alg239-R112]|uniref:chloride channel protein n=1 Tax=Lentilitoribacter sp. Alg239-R112 TaxID=2305987 RepID=UPI001FCE3303|nr:chloride channel protein [Lentilitoribacter sp. Alg239-R112]
MLFEITSKTIGLFSQWIRPNLSSFTTHRQPLIWMLGIIIGIGAAILVVLFNEFIGFVQYVWSGERSEIFLAKLKNVHFLVILLTPAAGGLIVGLLLQFVLKIHRAGSVADVMEARHVSGRKLSFREGVWSAIVTVISLGAGASAGREGPVIHLGASFASSLASKMKLPEKSSRTLLAAGAASAVSASFNAPIAGVLFAHEVILGHYSARSFVPIVLSSVSGTVISRLWLGEDTVFSIPSYEIISYFEFPAFFLLGMVCAFVAIIFQFSLFLADYSAKKLDLPLWIRPVLGGLALGIIGTYYPQILGIGYETTNDALWTRIPVMLMVVLITLKIFASALTYASRFGGGVFSPALYLGALTGGVFGITAAGILPEMASDPGLYAILGMGAVAATVIGAPISTTVIAFELTGGYTLSIALLLTIAVSHGINQAIHGRSFFHWQLELRGLDVRHGPYRAMLRNLWVSDIMIELDGSASGQGDDVLAEGDVLVLKPTDNFETALKLFDETGEMRLPVVGSNDHRKIIAWAEYTNAIDLINQSLIDVQEEEHQ